MKRWKWPKNRTKPWKRPADRLRAMLAVGFRLERTQEVHHHSPTQLVICENRAYHALLHRRTRELRRGLPLGSTRRSSGPSRYWILPYERDGDPEREYLNWLIQLEWRHPGFRTLDECRLGRPRTPAECKRREEAMIQAVLECDAWEERRLALRRERYRLKRDELAGKKTRRRRSRPAPDAL